MSRESGPLSMDCHHVLRTAPINIALADYRGISVAEVTPLRAKFMMQGIHYEVIKNKLAKRAIEGTDKDPNAELLSQ